MQAKESNNPIPISEQEIATRAYYLWEQNGRPGQRDLEFWTMAKAELMSRHESKATEAMMESATTGRRPRGAGRSSNRAPAMPRFGERRIVHTEAKKASTKRATP